MALFLGSMEHDLARLGPLRFWAERGLIHVEDARDNSYDSMSVRSALDRIRAINDMLGNRREKHSEDQYDQTKRAELMAFVEKMVDIIRKAREQGTPDDPAACREYVRR